MSKPTLPAPLVATHVDLTMFDWFPLKHKRLMESDWWVSASDFARSRNVDLWCASYEEIPAASLPDNDGKLAAFAGFGRDVNAFLQAKAELMGAWVLCNDGRWYHPTLAEVATEAWERKAAADMAREQDAARKRDRRAERNGASGGRPADVHGTSHGQAVEVQRTSDGDQSDVQRTSSGAKSPEPPKQQTGDIYNPPTPLAGGPRTSGGRLEDEVDLVRQAWEALPESARVSSSLTRFSAAWAVVVQGGVDPADLVEAATKAKTFYVKPENARRTPSAHNWLARGNYEAHLPPPPPTPWPGPPHIRAKIVEAMGKDGEAFARMYLDMCCGWQHLPEPTVTYSTGFVLDKLKASPAARIFREEGIVMAPKKVHAA